MPTPEELARQEIDRELETAGWQIQDYQTMNIHAAFGVAVREFPLMTGQADYLLYVFGKGVGTVEEKPAGHTLTGVENQSAKYAVGPPKHLPVWHYPLPFTYESAGKEIRFTNGLDPNPRT